LWKIDDVLEIKWIQNVLKIKLLYLADGHHRSAAALLSEENRFENTAKRLFAELSNF
jgi:uncharacterized protein (DUF1015 family)